MTNESDQKWYIVTEKDGEVIFTVDKGESINIRSANQARNDKFFSPKIKIKGTFIKVMDKEQEILEKLKDDPSAYLAIAIMKKYLVPRQNVLLKDGKKYKTIDLADEMGITRQWASRHIKKLKKLNVLSEVETNKGILLVMNPDFYHRGEDVDKRVYDLFNKPNK